MYRALALKALRAGVPLDSGAALAELARASRIELDTGGATVRLDGGDVGAAIRTREVAQAASRVSSQPALRREMVARQRELGSAGGVVLDGRDIGSAVFPDADLKFYVDADPAARAARRHRELRAAGQTAELTQIEAEIRQRDRMDSTRADSPLVRVPDAIVIDTTGLSAEQAVERLLAEARARWPELDAGRAPA